MDTRALFDQLRRSYSDITPQASQVWSLLESRGDTPTNDHVALRTFADPRIGLEVMGKVFEDLGFEARDRYVFEAKKLRARYYFRAGFPKVFISELDLGAMPEPVTTIINELIAQTPSDWTLDPAWIARGRPWSPTLRDYRTLAETSEYAAWLAAHGFCANHVTVDVGSLSSVADLAELTEVLAEAGFELNQAGGIIKGGPDVCLAQASTRADQIDVRFQDGTMKVPSCYVEFAQRYRQAGGEVYQGFIASSADKIFESTDRKPGE